MSTRMVTELLYSFKEQTTKHKPTQLLAYKAETYTCTFLYYHSPMDCLNETPLLVLSGTEGGLGGTCIPPWCALLLPGGKSGASPAEICDIMHCNFNSNLLVCYMCKGSQCFPGIKLPWFFMTLVSFLHDWRATTMANCNTNITNNHQIWLPRSDPWPYHARSSGAFISLLVL